MWPQGPVCPHCGSLEKLGKIGGKSARPGLYWCGNCKSQFTVTVGTIFERSKVPLSKWLFAIHLLASSKKGMSANQLSRMLGVTVQTAWFMGHRIRESMRDWAPVPMGGAAALLKSMRLSLAARKATRPELALVIRTSFSRSLSVAGPRVRSMSRAPRRRTFCRSLRQPRPQIACDD